MTIKQYWIEAEGREKSKHNFDSVRLSLGIPLTSTALRPKALRLWRLASGVRLWRPGEGLTAVTGGGAKAKLSIIFSMGFFAPPTPPGPPEFKGPSALGRPTGP